MPQGCAVPVLTHSVLLLVALVLLLLLLVVVVVLLLKLLLLRRLLLRLLLLLPQHVDSRLLGLRLVNCLPRALLRPRGALVHQVVQGVVLQTAVPAPAPTRSAPRRGCTSSVPGRRCPASSALASPPQQGPARRCRWDRGRRCPALAPARSLLLLLSLASAPPCRLRPAAPRARCASATLPAPAGRAQRARSAGGPVGRLLQG